MLTYTRQKSFKLSDATETKIKGYRHTLLEGTTPKNQKWSVSLIAGHVPESDEKEKKRDITNALSLVTLLTIGQNKGLFLGDATKATEKAATH